MSLINQKAPKLSIAIHVAYGILLIYIWTSESMLIHMSNSFRTIALLGLILLTSLLIYWYWIHVLRENVIEFSSTAESIAMHIDQSMNQMYRIFPYTIRPRPTFIILKRRAEQLLDSGSIHSSMSTINILHEFLKNGSLSLSLWISAVSLMLFLGVSKFPYFAVRLEELIIIKVLILWVLSCLLSYMFALITLSIFSSQGDN